MNDCAQRVLGLDGDGVLLDYHEGYAQAWCAAFGERPVVSNPDGYHPSQYWDVSRLEDPEARHHFRAVLHAPDTWSRFPAIPGALEACEALVEAGYSLVCVSALRDDFLAAREANLSDLGFPLSRVWLTGKSLARNPKQNALLALNPLAMVDDYLPYLQGLPPGTWRALVKGRPAFNPNGNTDLKPSDSVHHDLVHFARWWLTER